MKPETVWPVLWKGLVWRFYQDSEPGAGNPVIQPGLHFFELSSRVSGTYIKHACSFCWSVGLPFPGWISETDCGETLGVCLQTDFNPWEIHERVASLKEANYGDPCVADYDMNEALFGQVAG